MLNLNNPDAEKRFKAEESNSNKVEYMQMKMIVTNWKMNINTKLLTWGLTILLLFLTRNI